MTRKDIADRLDDVKTVIVPVASTEQHGPHLPLQHDTTQVCLIAEEAASRLYPKVLVTPPVAVGVSAHHLRWPMSLTLQPETFVNVIVDIQLKQVQQRLEDQHLTLELSDAAKALLAREGYDSVYGARPLKRAIQKHIENPLAMEILQGNLGEWDRVLADVNEGKIVFKS